MRPQALSHESQTNNKEYKEFKFTKRYTNQKQIFDLVTV